MLAALLCAWLLWSQPIVYDCTQSGCHSIQKRSYSVLTTYTTQSECLGAKRDADTFTRSIISNFTVGTLEVLSAGCLPLGITPQQAGWVK